MREGKAMKWEVRGPDRDGLYQFGCVEGDTFYILDRFAIPDLAQAMADKLNREAGNGR